MIATRFANGDVEIIAAEDVVKWMQGTEAGRLFLPPIQRSVVWKNAQIINYWDSLLRGYPAGLMMVHRSKANNGEIAKGRTADGKSYESDRNDFHLFDGQQRMMAILLGHRAGQLSKRLKLWIELGREPHEESDLLFQLLVSSTGQPFSYRAEAPNEKYPLKERRTRIAKWLERHSLTRFDPNNSFADVSGGDLIGAVCAVPFRDVIALLLSREIGQAFDEVTKWYPTAPPERVERFLNALDSALKRPILFQLIDEKLVENESEYMRFFGRHGQGGTPLTNDELTYSIIKHQYPEVHDRMEEIMTGSVGRVASEVNLVLGTLRVARARADWDSESEWEKIGRPQPAFVARLKQLHCVQEEFQRMIPLTSGGRLKELLEMVRERLVYHPKTNPLGLPVMLLARMPHPLVDVLLLLMSRWQQKMEDDPLPAFVLYWLLFVTDNDKAAYTAFRVDRMASGGWSRASLQELSGVLEEEGSAMFAPRIEQVATARLEVEAGNHILRTWSERFASLDSVDSGDHKRGDALRILSTDPERIKRVLLWLQRDYLSANYCHYDPTSNRDEDLPVDLDHLIPNSKFGFHWKSRGSHLGFDDHEENFRGWRGTIGNSLGNYRWLDAADNRSRGNRQIETSEGDAFNILHAERWNQLIEHKCWDSDDVANFQKLIDLRTLDLYEQIVTGARIDAVLPPQQ